MTQIFGEAEKSILREPPPIAIASAFSAPPALFKIPILVYHHVTPLTSSSTASLLGVYNVTPDMFDRQLSYLKTNGYAVISFDDLVSAMLDATATVPLKSIVLTFDDGWKSQYQYAFPIIQKYGDTATFFVFTNGMNSNHKGFMTWDEVRALSAAHMTIGSHSISHPYLFRVTNQTDLYKEIAESKTMIESHIGTSVDLFAYPFGTYSPEELAEVKAAGYRAARTDDGLLLNATTSENLYTLGGVQPTNNFDDFLRLIKSVE